jgi:hypothetical protein
VGHIVKTVGIHIFSRTQTKWRIAIGLSCVEWKEGLRRL